MNTDTPTALRDRCQAALDAFYRAMGQMTMARKSSLLPKPYKEPIRTAAVALGVFQEYTESLEDRVKAMEQAIAAARRFEDHGRWDQDDDCPMPRPEDWSALTEALAALNAHE